MIKDFETYINEDYFSKLTNRKDTCNVRKENEITEDFVRSFAMICGNISFRKENGKKLVDIDGDFVFSGLELGDTLDDIFKKFSGKLPFQFGKVTGDFDCSEMGLKTLEGCPKEVGGNFFADINILTSLEDGPEIVGGSFSCGYCENLTSLEGCPKEVGREFYCRQCGKKFTEEEVKSLCNVKGKIVV